MAILRKLGNLGMDIVTLGGHSSADAAKRGLNSQLSALESQQQQLGQQNQAQLQDVTNTFNPFTSSAGADFNAYRNAANQDLSQYKFDPFQEFDQSSVSKYIDPSIKYQTQQATQAIEGSAANRGKLFSGATGTAIADRAQQIGQTGYQQALQSAQDEWRSRMGYNQQAKTQGLNIAQQGIQNAGNVAQMGYGATQQAANARMGLNQGYNQNMMQMQQNQANLQAQKQQVPGAFGQVMNAVPAWASIAGSFLGKGK